jgi:hypothetical protein
VPVYSDKEEEDTNLVANGRDRERERETGMDEFVVELGTSGGA